MPPHNHILTQDRKLFTAHTTSSSWFFLIGQLHFEGTAISTVSCRGWSLSEIKPLSTMYCIVMKSMWASPCVCVCMCLSVLEFTLFVHTVAHKHKEMLAMLNWLDFTPMLTDAGSRKTRETKLPWYKINLLARDNCETYVGLFVVVTIILFSFPLPPLSSFFY